MDETVQKIMSPRKGVLALDWSPKTIAKQFLAVGLVSTPELNRVYRQMLLTSEGLEKYISAVILHSETVVQKLDGGLTFPQYLNNKGIVVGVRADNGSSNYGDTPQEMSIGLDGLSQRFLEFSKLGIKFTKWRAGFKISDIYPSESFVNESLDNLSEFAEISHRFGLVPFVEPDVEISGTHTTTRCAQITATILTALFKRLSDMKVNLGNVILKTNMVMPGVDSGVIASPLEVANATLATLRKTVPKNIGGIVFLSGGQSFDDSVMHLDKIQDLAINDSWKLSFSYARSLQKDALLAWKGLTANNEEAQKIFLTRLLKVAKARMGEL